MRKIIFLSAITIALMSCTEPRNDDSMKKYITGIIENRNIDFILSPIYEDGIATLINYQLLDDGIIVNSKNKAFNEKILETKSIYIPYSNIYWIGYETKVQIANQNDVKTFLIIEVK